MLPVDLSHEQFMKVWRVTGDRVDATAAVVRRGSEFTATVHYRYADGRSRSWTWRPREGLYLSGRELVRCMNSIDRGFRAIPGVHIRIDFPQDASREDQTLILMEYGLHRLFLDTTTTDGDLDGPFTPLNEGGHEEDWQRSP